MRVTFIASAICVSLAVAPAVAQQSEPAFEVASIKENRSGDTRTSMNVVGGRLIAVNIPLEGLIGGAYGGTTPLPPTRVVMPAGWTGAAAPRFDIQATPAR